MRYLFFLLILMVCFKAESADFNYSLDGSASVSITIGSQVGSASNTNDDSESTNMQVGNSGPPGVPIPLDYTLTINLDKSHKLTSVELVHSLTVVASLAKTKYSVELYYGGAWHSVLNPSVPTAKTTASSTGTWQDVSAIRLDVDCADIPGGGFPAGIVTNIYELRAIGPEIKNNYIISFL